MIDFLLSAHWKQSLLTDFLFRKIEKYIFKNRNLKTSISNLEKDQIPRTFLVQECQKPEKIGNVFYGWSLWPIFELG